MSAYSYQYWYEQRVGRRELLQAGTARGWTTVSSNPSQLHQLRAAAVDDDGHELERENTESVSRVSTVVYDPNAPRRQSGRHSRHSSSSCSPRGQPRYRYRRSPAQPQPLVAIEDAKNQIVYSDASSVSLKIRTGPAGGALSSSCARLRTTASSRSGLQPQLVGNYTLQAVDTDGFRRRSRPRPPTPSLRLRRLNCAHHHPSPCRAWRVKTRQLGKFTVTQEDYLGTPVNAGAGGTTVQLRRARPAPTSSTLPRTQPTTTGQSPRRS